MGVKNGVADDAEIAGYQSPLHLYIFNIYSGSFCLVFVCLNLFILITTKRFRKQFQVSFFPSKQMVIWGVFLRF